VTSLSTRLGARIQWSGVLVILAVAAAIVVSRAIRMNSWRMGDGVDLISLGTSSPGPSSTPTPYLIVNGQAIRASAFHDRFDGLLGQNPEMSRNEACDQTIEYFVDYVLLRDDRLASGISIGSPTLTAVFEQNTSATTEAATLAPPSTPSSSPESTATTDMAAGWVGAALLGTVAAVSEYDGRFATAMFTPSADEIATRVSEMAGISLDIAVITTESKAQTSALYTELQKEWRSAKEGAFLGQFLDRAVAQQSLASPAAAIVKYRLSADLRELSGLPDYVQTIVTSHSEGNYLYPYVRADGTGVVAFVTDHQVRPGENEIAAAAADIGATRDAEARATYATGLRTDASIQINVNCATY